MRAILFGDRRGGGRDFITLATFCFGLRGYDCFVFNFGFRAMMVNLISMLLGVSSLIPCQISLLRLFSSVFTAFFLSLYFFFFFEITSVALLHFKIPFILYHALFRSLILWMNTTKPSNLWTFLCLQGPNTSPKQNANDFSSHGGLDVLYE